MEIKFRNFVTLLIMGGLIGGAGVVISYDGLANENVILTEIIAPDGTITNTFKDNSLAESQVFNIWLGAILGFGGAIVAVLYKAKEDSEE